MTRPTNSGRTGYTRPESEAEGAVELYIDMLGRHIAEHGYPTPPACKADPLLLLSGDDLRAMTLAELDDVLLELTKAVYAIGDEQNVQKAKEERCRTELAKLVGHDLDNKIFGRDDKWMDAAHRDDEAWGWWLTLQHCKTSSLRLDGQAMRLNEIVRVISNIRYSKA